MSAPRVAVKADPHPTGRRRGGVAAEAPRDAPRQSEGAAHNVLNPLSSYEEATIVGACVLRCGMRWPVREADAWPFE